MEREKIIEEAKRIIETEYKNLEKVKENLDNNFVSAVELILNCRGKVVITGMGKSGIIGRKISATLASIGIPSTFLHPGEAIHGDLGMVSANDIVIAISNSGETEEILRIIPSIKKIGAQIISITSSRYLSISSSLNSSPPWIVIRYRSRKILSIVSSWDAFFASSRTSINLS